MTFMSIPAFCHSPPLPKKPERSKLRGIRPVASEEMANPLFFGGFTNFTEAEYVTFLSEQLTDDRAARLLLIKDLYSMGVVLKRKYRLLKYAYSFAALSVVFPVVFLVMYHFR
jgi:hypothetical protein